MSTTHSQMVPRKENKVKWNRMRSCKYGSMLTTGESRWIRFREIALLLQLFCRFEFFQIQIWRWEIRMQGNQNASKKKKGKKNLRAFVLIVNLSSCHSDCHRAIASMLVNAEKLYSTWQDGRHLLGSVSIACSVDIINLYIEYIIFFLFVCLWFGQKVDEYSTAKS